jgi:hypothetical protein
MKHCFSLFLITLAIMPLNLLSQISTQTQPQKKVALVIGNGNYVSSILANPENDARSMADVLKRLGFTVYKYENLSQENMLRAIDDFGLKLKGNDVGLFFYAGHGIQSKGYNFLVPVDAQLKAEADVEYDCVQADRILAKMESSGIPVNIIILDACRNNPFERSWTRSETGKGLAFMDAPSGTLIAYSTAPGNTALDGSGKNSPYTAAILESILIPKITITQMFQNVGRILIERTNKQQTPWIASSLIGDFYFNLLDSSKIIETGFIRINPGYSNDTLKYDPSHSMNTSNSLQKKYMWSVFSLIKPVNYYIEKAYTTRDEFGTWVPLLLVYKEKVAFNEDGSIKEIEEYNPRKASKELKNNSSVDELVEKRIYKSISPDSIRVIRYYTIGTPSKPYFINFINDTIVQVDKEKYILKNSKIMKMVDQNISSVKKTWEYLGNGLVSKIFKSNTRKVEILNKYEYLEYDNLGNWIKRLEYNSSWSSMPDLIVFREYTY